MKRWRDISQLLARWWKSDFSPHLHLAGWYLFFFFLTKTRIRHGLKEGHGWERVRGRDECKGPGKGPN